MLIIRLQRVGRTNDPSFRVVVTDSKNAAKSGKFIEVVGSYDARQGKPQFKAERIQKWIKDGAQVSETVHNLLVKNKIIEGATLNTVPVKKVAAVEKAESAQAIEPASSVAETTKVDEAPKIEEEPAPIITEETTAPVE